MKRSRPAVLHWATESVKPSADVGGYRRMLLETQGYDVKKWALYSEYFVETRKSCQEYVGRDH